MTNKHLENQIQKIESDLWRIWENSKKDKETFLIIIRSAIKAGKG